MMLASAIYEGVVRHRRMTPREHSFEFALFMVYLDLAEMDRVFSMTRWWSMRRMSPARFRREDYLGATGSLDGAVRERVERETGRRPTGPIRLLTHLRYFGCCFNPVSFYYCFDERGERVETIVAEITNTPWKERHTYVLDRSAGCGSGELMRWEFEKRFHVSPFMPMGMQYDWAFAEPGEELFVHMNVRESRGERDKEAGTQRVAEVARGFAEGDGGKRQKAFDATLRLTRRELTPSRMRMQLIRFPLMTLRVIGRVHFEALRLWLKRVPVQAHPGMGGAGTGGVVSVKGAAT